MKTTKLLVLCATLATAIPAQAFYAPAQQRWLNRDPIEENGGINLYEFADNEPVANIDSDGLSPGTPGPKPKPPVPDEYGNITVTCKKVPGGGRNGLCLYQCDCPGGYWNGGISRFITRPCGSPPTQTCVPKPQPNRKPVLCWDMFWVYVDVVLMREGGGALSRLRPRPLPTHPPLPSPVPVTP
ncbi:MAG: hypothetical protein HOP33_21690 [Verrucomicrobia bacterium]|nr:hypothetical protein [Verrucomicrobiota bacterium]